MLQKNSFDITEVIKQYAKLKKNDGVSADFARYSGPYLDEKDLKAVLESLLDGFLTGWLGFGKNAHLFEKKFAIFLGRKYAIFTNSGSSANLLAISSLASLGKLKKNDEVLTIAATFPTTINPLILYGLRPVFVDIKIPSFTVDVNSLKKATTKKTKAIFLPHLAGSPHDMKAISKFAKRNNLMVIEDVCDALGSKVYGRNVGTFGISATFSFYVAHHITTGEGGMVVTDDKKVADTIRSLRDWGRITISKVEKSTELRKKEHQSVSKTLPKDYEKRFTYSNIGFNLKPIDLQGALGISQLKKINEFKKKRHNNYRKLIKGLSNYNSLILPKSLLHTSPSWFVFPIIISKNAKFSRQNITDYLEKNEIETRPMLAGNIIKHPAYKGAKFRIGERLENTETVLRNCFCVGVYPGLSNDKIDYILHVMKKFLDRNQ